MKRRRHLLLIRPLLCALVPALAGGCSSSTEPSGNPDGDLDVEFRVFRTTAWEMRLDGGPATTVVGNLSNGNPTLYRVANPGVGNSLDFVATSGADTLSTTCTVTSATGVSEPPQVVVQPAFATLDCVSW
jgi:hypothetical protein